MLETKNVKPNQHSGAHRQGQHARPPPPLLLQPPHQPPDYRKG